MEFLSITKRYNTSNGNLKQELAKKNPEAVGSACRLLQYCQIPNKYSNHISRDIWNFRGASNFPFIYSAIFHGTPSDILRNTCVQTLVCSLVLNTSTRVMNHLL